MCVHLTHASNGNQTPTPSCLPTLVTPYHHDIGVLILRICNDFDNNRHIYICGKTDHFGTSEMHFIAPSHAYTHTLSKHSDRMLFHTIFRDYTKHWEASTDSRNLWGGGLNRMAWMQSMTQMLASSCVVLWLVWWLVWRMAESCIEYSVFSFIQPLHLHPI